MVTVVVVATITATAGKSLRLPRVAVFKVSLYQEVFCVLFLQAPPSLSLRVSYTKTSTAVEEIEELIPERFNLFKSVLPTTCSFAVGLLVPIPKLPLLSNLPHSVVPGEDPPPLNLIPFCPCIHNALSV